MSDWQMNNSQPSPMFAQQAARLLSALQNTAAGVASNPASLIPNPVADMRGAAGNVGRALYGGQRPDYLRALMAMIQGGAAVGMARPVVSSGLGASGYEGVPDNLLGFKTRPGSSQTPYVLRGGKEFRVVVDYGEAHGGPWEDGVKAVNKWQALEHAKRNWPGAHVVVYDEAPVP